MLFFESGWYVGNIYNAVNGAKKYNRRAEQSFLDNLSGRYGVSFSREGRGTPFLALTLRF